MKNKMMRLAAKATVVTMVASMMATVLPASAAGVTSVSDTMDRLKISESASHVVSFTVPAMVNAETITFTYTGFGADMAGSPVCTPQSGTLNAGVSGNVITFTASGAVGAGAVTCTAFTLTNPGTSDTYTVSVAGSVIDSSSFQIYIMDDDQVSVTADIDPTMSFDLDVSLIDTETASTYTVDFGEILFGTPEASDNTNYPSIWIDLATNASSGAVVTVKSANAAMVSTSTSDSWATDAGNLAANAEHYGICVDNTISGTLRSGTFTAQGDYATGVSCDGGATMDIGAVSTSATNILSATGPITGGRAQVRVGISVANTTPAHPDYTDTLTFIATGTF